MCADRRERGSVLVLMPAAVLVFLVLGALAVDFGLVFLAQREVANAAAGAANDAAVAALSETAFYEGGRLELDASEAQRVVASAFAARRAGWLHEAQVRVLEIGVVDGARVRVTVQAEAAVDLVFSRGLPGAPVRQEVRARATASAVQG